jgi:hypothetical protein
VLRPSIAIAIARFVKYGLGIRRIGRDEMKRHGRTISRQ